MDGVTFKRLDWLALGIVLVLLSLSIAFIYSAQFRSDNVVGNNYLRQLFFAVFGLGAYGALARYNYARLAALSGWIYSASMGLLLLVFLFPKVNGAHRWIPLAGVTLQPSELAKLAMIISLAAYLSAPDRDVESRQTLIGCAVIVGLPFLLIVAEPDLSTALTLTPVALAIMLHMGVQRKFLLISIAVVGVIMALLCFWIAFEKPEEESAVTQKKRLVLPHVPFLKSYQKERIRVFLTKEHDLADAGWNKLQAQIAVGSGGLFGKGYLKGTQNILGFLPRTVAPSDFIFCVVAEETGFVGGVFFISLYTLLLGRCMRTAVRARDNFGRLLALGISVMLFCHVFINIAMTVGLMPITGLPLPLMSYGGSFTVSTLIELGLVQSIYLRRRRR